MKTTIGFKLATVLLVGISFLKLELSFAKDNDHQDITGTVKVQGDEVVYPGLAKITFKQAGDSALGGFPGQVLKIELDEEDGFLVYEVEIVTSHKEIIEVLVDAGNGAILRMEEEEPGDSDKQGHDGKNKHREDKN